MGNSSSLAAYRADRSDRAYGAANFSRVDLTDRSDRADRHLDSGHTYELIKEKETLDAKIDVLSELGRLDGIIDPQDFKTTLNEVYPNRKIPENVINISNQINKVRTDLLADYEELDSVLEERENGNTRVYYNPYKLTTLPIGRLEEIRRNIFHSKENETMTLQQRRILTGDINHLIYNIHLNARKELPKLEKSMLKLNEPYKIIFYTIVLLIFYIVVILLIIALAVELQAWLDEISSTPSPNS